MGKRTVRELEGKKAYAVKMAGRLFPDTACKCRGIAGSAFVAFLVCALYVMGAACLMPIGHAHADSLVAASTVENTVITNTKQELEAYDRAVAACMDYANQPNPIVVNMSDLGLTKAQAENVWEMVFANSELFWINCYGDTYTKDEFRLPCYYDDATIDTMRAKLDKEVAKGLKRIGPGMDDATKVHMLHDFVLDRVEYQAGSKTAYTAFVERKLDEQGNETKYGRADCYGFTMAMDLMLRRAGFEVDVAFNSSMDHSWNLVKVDGTWYHVDSTWDNGYVGKNYGGNWDWSKRRCHLYLLESDESMNNRAMENPSKGEGSASIKSHAGWRCHHTCPSTKYDYVNDFNKGFYKHCNDYKSIVREFTVNGLEFVVTDVKKVSFAGVADENSPAKAITVPANVTFGDVTYGVNGIEPGALSSSNVKVVRVATAKLAKARVKDSLVDSKVKKVKLVGDATKRLGAYEKFFKKSNCGREVAVVR